MAKNKRRNNATETAAPAPATLRPLPVLVHLAFVAIALFLFVGPILGDVNTYPANDNLYFHILNYVYFSNSFLHGYGAPLWHHTYGGVPIGISSIPGFPFLPHRMVGYFLYAVLPLAPITLYKLTLTLGILLVGIGWWFFLAKITRSRIGATFGVLMMLWGGNGMTVFHQEQILATLTWIPWLLLAAWRIPEDKRFVGVTAILAGFSATVHYPQLQLLWMLFLLTGLLVSRHIRWSDIQPFLKKKRLVAVSLLLFLLAASPLVYLARHKDDYGSLLRKTQDLETTSFSHYIGLNEQQMSSVIPDYLANYVRPNPTSPFIDQYVCFITVTGLLFAVLGLIFRARAALPFGILAGLTAWMSLGINGNFAQFLYLLHFPLIKLFRQWGHVLPVTNLALSACAAFGFTAFFAFLERRVKTHDTAMKFTTLLLATLFILGISGAEAFRYRNAYHKYWLVHANDGPGTYSESQKPWLDHAFRATEKKLSKDAFIDRLRDDDFTGIILMPSFVVKEWFRIIESASQIAYKNILRSQTVLLVPEVTPERLREFVETGAARTTLLSDDASLKDADASGTLKIVDVGDGPVTADLAGANPQENYFFPPREYEITPRGASLKGFAPQATLVAMPFARRLGFKATVNGRPASLRSVYGGAFTGIVVPPGSFTLEIRIPRTLHHITVWIQLILFWGMLAWVVLSKVTKSQQRKNSSDSSQGHM